MGLRAGGVTVRQTGQGMSEMKSADKGKLESRGLHEVGRDSGDQILNSKSNDLANGGRFMESRDLLGCHLTFSNNGSSLNGEGASNVTNI